MEKEQEREASLEPLHEHVDWICDGLGFGLTMHPVRDITSLVAARVWYLDVIQKPNSFDNFNLAAACVYMASHLVCQRLRMRDIAQVSGLTQESISHAYRLLDEEQEMIVGDDLLDEDSPQYMDGRGVSRALRRLPRPVTPSYCFRP